MAIGIGQPFIHCQPGGNYHLKGQVVVVGGFWGAGNVGSIGGFKLVASIIGTCGFKLLIGIVGVRFITIDVKTFSTKANYKKNVTKNYMKLTLAIID